MRLEGKLFYVETLDDICAIESRLKASCITSYSWGAFDALFSDDDLMLLDGDFMISFNSLMIPVDMIYEPEDIRYVTIPAGTRVYDEVKSLSRLGGV